MKNRNIIIAALMLSLAACGSGGGAQSQPAANITVTDSVAPDNDLQVQFGSITQNSTSDQVVTITNSGNADLIIGAIAGTESLALPFSVTADTCSGQTIVPSDNCTLTVRFEPTALETFNDSFDIPSDDVDSPSVIVTVSGTGAAVPVPNIAVQDSVAPADDRQVPFGTVTRGNNVNETVTVANNGNTNLVIGTITGVTAPFSIATDACSNQTLAPSASCSVTITFAPTGGGIFNNSLAIPNNDPDENVVTLSVSGGSPNVVFATSVAGTGNLGSWPDAGGMTGLLAADAICQARAGAASITGTFKAWISDDNNDAYCRIHNLSGKKSAKCGQASLPVSAGPWVRTDGFPFGEAIGQLLYPTGKVYAPVRFNEFGNLLAAGDMYFTNTTPDGILDSGYPTACSNWTSNSSAVYTVFGVADMTTDAWSRWVFATCVVNSRLLCMQVGSGSTLPVFAASGKKIFITSTHGNGKLGSWSEATASGKTGVAAGDTICQARAAAAGLQNAANFKAWLSDTATDAINRITSNGPWVRLDGVKVADNKTDLTDGSIFTAINLTETGQYENLNYPVWTGTQSTGLKVTDTCNSWVDNTNLYRGTSGDFLSAGSKWTEYPINLLNCDYGWARLYCIED